MNQGVSIILCTYNGKNRLDATLSHLARQQVSVPCELILVDNASTDDTKTFADTWWQHHGTPKISYRSFEQPISGKSYAQDLGYEKAQYEYLLVCDDDNWLCDTYVQSSYEVMESDLQIGALGGWCEAAFESEKPSWFDRYARYYAVAKQGKESGDITNKKGCLYGAGMVLRKSHWLELKQRGFVHLLTCRKGTSLSSGGDTEYSYALRLLGYKIWYDERLYFTHYMTSGRLHLEYLSRLRKAINESDFVLWAYLDLLKDSPRTQQDFLKQALKGMPLLCIKKLRLLLLGDYEQKEQAKFYFRNLGHLLFSYSSYRKHFESMKIWLF